MASYRSSNMISQADQNALNMNISPHRSNNMINDQISANNFVRDRNNSFARGMNQNKNYRS